VKVKMIEMNIMWRREMKSGEEWRKKILGHRIE
jgi:hypothetical protein